MQEVNFYDTNDITKENVILKLLSKIYYTKMYALVKVSDALMLRTIDESLWSFSRRELIAHGTKNDPHPERQPIYITDKQENPNNASILMLINSNWEGDISSFSKILYIFSGNMKDEHELALSYYKELIDKNLKPKFWFQEAEGKWVQKVPALS